MCWKIFHIQYWSSFIYLKGIHSPNVLRPVILKRCFFVFLDKLQYEGMVILYLYSGIFLLVLSWCDIIVRTICSIFQYIRIIHNIFAVLRFVLLYLWLLSSNIFCYHYWLAYFSYLNYTLIEHNFVKLYIYSHAISFYGVQTIIK